MGLEILPNLQCNQVWNSFGSTNERGTTDEDKNLEKLKADHAAEIEQMNDRMTESKKKQWVKNYILNYKWKQFDITLTLQDEGQKLNVFVCRI